MNRVLGDITSASSSVSTASGAFAWLDEPAVSAVATTITSNNRLLDEVDRLIQSYHVWPHGYPADKKTPPERSIRIFYRRTNDIQASTSFTNILENYRDHVLHKNAHTLVKYPYAKEYLTEDPLGLTEHDLSDTRIYKNATKLAAVIREPSPTSTERTEVSDEEDDASHSGVSDTAGSTTNADDASATRPAEGIPRPPLARVKTTFASILEKLQLDLYLFLRANVSRFMDETSNNVIERRIVTYEHDKGLIGRDRIAMGLRYSWQMFKADVYDLCCALVAGGFYFLPFYTTPRTKNMIISKWCDVIRKIHKQLMEFLEEWGRLSERDAMKRLRSFLSKKEVEIIEIEVRENHPDIWEKHRKSIRVFFHQHPLGDTIRLINNIDTAKFPLGFDPVKHTPDALKETLYSYSDLQLKETEKAAENRALANENKKLKNQLDAALKAGNKRNRNTKRQNDTGAAAEADVSDSEKRLSKESPAVRRLMRKNKRGHRPCLQCARDGLRRFHKVCDPAKRAADVKRTKQQKRDNPTPKFPPDEKDRKYPLSSYSSSACKHCKREDVKPSIAENDRHFEDSCYRRPGGECDQKGAKTRRARTNLVKSLAMEAKKEAGKRKSSARDDSNPKKRGKGVRFKTTEMAVRPAPHAASQHHATEQTSHSTGTSAGASPARNNIPDPRLEGTGSHETWATVATGATLNPTPVSNLRRKVRSRKYKRSQMAERYPITSDELDYAWANCPHYIKKGHIVYQLEAEGKEENLIAFRKDMARDLKTGYVPPYPPPYPSMVDQEPLPDPSVPTVTPLVLTPMPPPPPQRQQTLLPAAGRPPSPPNSPGEEASR